MRQKQKLTLPAGRFKAISIVSRKANRERTCRGRRRGAGFWNIKDGASSFGPSVAVEVRLIENWFELEVGTTPLFKRHLTEWGTDLTESVRAEQYSMATNSLRVEAVADFMFWRCAKHRFGWYLEATYEYNFDAPMNNRLASLEGWYRSRKPCAARSSLSFAFPVASWSTEQELEVYSQQRSKPKVVSDQAWSAVHRKCHADLW
jgi:hypothetical protein